MRRMAIVLVASSLWTGTALAHQQGKKLHLAEVANALTARKGHWPGF